MEPLFSTGAVLPARHIWLCGKTGLVVTTGRGGTGVLWVEAGDAEYSRMPRTPLQRGVFHPRMSNARAEKP